jgi:hypothetical protein
MPHMPRRKEASTLRLTLRERVETSAGAYADWLNAALILAIIGFAVGRAVTGNGVHLITSGSVSGQARDVLWFALLCGLASLATIEILKRVFGLRGLYQRRQTELWLRGRTPRNLTSQDPFTELLDAMGVRVRASDTDSRMAGPASGDRNRVFNLPPTQLAAQVSAAADIALTTVQDERNAGNDRYMALISSLIGAVPSSRSKIARPSDSKAAQVRKSNTAAVDSEEADEFEDAQRTRAGIDQLHISLAERWRRYIQGAAVWVSGAYGIALTHAAHLASKSEPHYVLGALLLGGFFAWTIRDVTAVIERLRR